MSNISLKVFWNNKPIPVSQKVQNSDLVINVPFGALITHPASGGGIYSINGKTSSTIVLNAEDIGAEAKGAVDQVENKLNQATNELTNQINTKASAFAVTQALSLKADLVNGIIPANLLPSFVDDVVEFNSWNEFPPIGDAGKIYIDTTENKTYRWSGSSYITIGGGGVALGETAATAYRGDRGKAAYDHSLSQGNPHGATTTDIIEGSRLYFTDERVKNTVLTGLTPQKAGEILSTDKLIDALAKLQAQNSSKANEVVWLNMKAIEGASFRLFETPMPSYLEFAKINGNLWIRGWLYVSSTIPTNTMLFRLYNPAYALENLLDVYSYFNSSFDFYKVSPTNIDKFTMSLNYPNDALNGIKFGIEGYCIESNLTTGHYNIPAQCIGKLVS
ncbi:hypothetical protein ACG9XY_12305 [Acinetobacter seifertii]|uniref:hypothetical protein n=1 Tax=Acinetobacter seifertii TaxID=1530123 RepID=UPI0029408B60|nr:hypothetical protein [Acinetobacter seifertii]MDV4263302.1 hypothetical protein [Acinetobacter seifertii]